MNPTFLFVGRRQMQGIWAFGSQTELQAASVRCPRPWKSDRLS
jgi:hypothetical protein